MTTYNNIKNWLSSSIKNRYFFATMKLFDTAYAETKLFSDAKETLAKNLTDNMTREEFLEWRALWREVYAKLTSESQMSKHMRSSNEVSNVDPSNAVSTYTASINQVYAYRLKGIAEDLLALRVTAKEYSVLARSRQAEAA